MGVTHCTLQPEAVDIKEARVDEKRCVRGCGENRERTLNWEDKEAIEEIALGLIETNYGEAIADNRVD